MKYVLIALVWCAGVCGVLGSTPINIRIEARPPVNEMWSIEYWSTVESDYVWLHITSPGGVYPIKKYDDGYIWYTLTCTNTVIGTPEVQITGSNVSSDKGDYILRMGRKYASGTWVKFVQLEYVGTRFDSVAVGAGVAGFGLFMGWMTRKAFGTKGVVHEM